MSKYTDLYEAFLRIITTTTRFSIYIIPNTYEGLRDLVRWMRDRLRGK